MVTPAWFFAVHDPAWGLREISFVKLDEVGGVPCGTRRSEPL